MTGRDMMKPTLGQLSEITGAELRGDPDRVITHAATLQDATEGAISFLRFRDTTGDGDEQHEPAVLEAGSHDSSSSTSRVRTAQLTTLYGSPLFPQACTISSRNVGCWRLGVKS